MAPNVSLGRNNTHTCILVGITLQFHDVQTYPQQQNKWYPQRSFCLPISKVHSFYLPIITFGGTIYFAVDGTCDLMTISKRMKKICETF